MTKWVKSKLCQHLLFHDRPTPNDSFLNYLTELQSYFFQSHFSLERGHPYLFVYCKSDLTTKTVLPPKSCTRIQTIFFNYYFYQVCLHFNKKKCMMDWNGKNYIFIQKKKKNQHWQQDWKSWKLFQLKKYFLLCYFYTLLVLGLKQAGFEAMEIF